MPDKLFPGDSVRVRYDDLVAEGKLEPDTAQAALASRFDALNEKIGSLRLASKSSSLGWLFAKRAPKPDAVKGLYVQGGVGRGKTMLMDFFYRACPAQRKRRAHFHDFMADVHDRIGAYRSDLKNGREKGDDPIPPVARAIAAEARVLCFDEFSVTDIADAMILSRLFDALFSQGVILVATSNVLPEDLYKDGLNRGLFLPFVETLKKHVDVVSLDAERDYRLDKLSNTRLYVTPLGGAAEMAMDEAWYLLTGGTGGGGDVIEVKGREIAVREAAKGAARFTFAELCEQPLGSRDYLAIARAFHTVFVEDVPVIRDGQRNEVKRFINLVDTLYDNCVRLVVSAAAEPHELYQADSGTEAFEFERTVSRLVEMRSEAWAAQCGRAA
ncbi:cell division protein ZapE [Oricola cellulosilytica]|uniref:Cell division protein ZapE n=1 Tax=Oricola cellulosilytica TaxID=1429082 RepID=A0A4R0PH69_9HYPH|nr:cell division protein ZapE [Oricola cellulosilytica]TCD15940.1 cell division protein ZapE [Oricola cellulosilytica]